MAHITKESVMNDTIVILEKSHVELVDTVTAYYSKQFDKTWGEVLSGVRKSQHWQPLSDEIKSILHAYKLQFRRLRKRERELFTDIDRMQGLRLCQELHQHHQSFEEAFYLELTNEVDFSDAQKKILHDCWDYRVERLHAAHRAARLYIDQSKIIIANAESTTPDLRKKAVDEGLQFYVDVLAQLSGKPKPVRD